MKANCVVCGKEFDKHGLKKTCGKECSAIAKRESNRRWEAANREKKREWLRRWRAANRQKKREKEGKGP